LHGSIKWQVREIFHKSGINKLGQSKHSAKEAVRSTLQSQSQSETWHKIGKGIGIHSYSTADAYRDVWRQLGNYVKSEFQIKDMEKLTGNHVQSFLESKITSGVAHATFMQYAAACEKLEVALNGYSDHKHLENPKYSENHYHFSEQIADARADAHQMLDRFEGSRAYSDPESLIKSIQDESHNLAASMQYEGGARVHEISLIKPDQLAGLREDSITGEMKGHIDIEGKGGKENEVALSAETYQRLENHIHDHGEFRIDKDEYRSDLKDASEKTEQEYTGSHGLRWSFAQERFQEIQQHGLTYEEALSKVSKELGHERADITEHYLK